MNRTFVIGDIHGGLRALPQVMQRANADTGDKLVFLGDYVDGWSESAQTIDYLIQLSASQPCVFIKGNHDSWCEDWLATGRADKNWTVHGGKATVDSYVAVDVADKQRHLSFFETMRWYEIDEKNRLFIHAGFTSLQGPQKEFYSSNFSWDRTLWETALDAHEAIQKDPALLPKRLTLFEEIYIGHTPTLYYNHTEPMHASNVWNLDTGAAFTGKLTIMDIETKEFWQSDTLKELYPGEAGRNRSS